jgi:hypothetical protein
MRDFPGWGIYFFSYEALQKLVGIKTDGVSNVNTNNFSSILLLMLCGGWAGQLSWIVSYPADVIKTTIQVTTTEKLTMRYVASTNYRAHGLSWFFKGMSAALARSFVVNSITLPVYDYLYYKSNLCLGAQHE